MIELTDITFAYGDHDVLDDISLSVASGELVGLIGPNGAGKTTLLRLTAGTLQPADGVVRVDGDSIHALSSKAASRRVGVVPQKSTLSFDFPVREVVAMGRHPYHSRFSRAIGDASGIIDRALSLTETDGFADRSFSAISGGERKRVLIARALAQDTSNLLIDEPTASLDINHQIAVFELIRRLLDEDKAILTAVHDLNLAARYCDRLVLLADTTIQARGHPDDVLKEGVLNQAYGSETAVVTNPVTGTPLVVAASSETTPTGAAEVRSADVRPVDHKTD